MRRNLLMTLTVLVFAIALNACKDNNPESRDTSTDTQVKKTCGGSCEGKCGCGGEGKGGCGCQDKSTADPDKPKTCGGSCEGKCGCGGEGKGGCGCQTKGTTEEPAKPEETVTE